jgi:hypothetical protein
VKIYDGKVSSPEIYELLGTESLKSAEGETARTRSDKKVA